MWIGRKHVTGGEAMELDLAAGGGQAVRFVRLPGAVREAAP